MLFAIVIALGVMAASTLESEAAFRDRASQIGVEDRYIDKFAEKNFAAFGRYAFCVVYSPNYTDEAPLRTFCRTCWRSSQGQPKWLVCGGCFSRAIQWPLQMQSSELRHRRTRQWRPGSHCRESGQAKRAGAQVDRPGLHAGDDPSKSPGRLVRGDGRIRHPVVHQARAVLQPCAGDPLNQKRCIGPRTRQV